ncbi:BrnA antitoxin family protein [Candidatus Halobeggiatoa sp. HSG11]|nr:BrnA antitoxin family protein [Candidatus Halobeggiatoa sp. HSG11]
MPKLKQGTIIPTPDEDVVITKAALSDPNAQPFSDIEWEQVKPLLKQAKSIEQTKKSVTIYLSHEVIDYFRTGKDWQTNIDKALQEYIVLHK